MGRSKSTYDVNVNLVVNCESRFIKKSFFDNVNSWSCKKF